MSVKVGEKWLEVKTTPHGGKLDWPAAGPH